MNAPPPGVGIGRNPVNYGDRDFSLFLRKAMIKGSGYGEGALARPVVGIVNTGSGFNPCHGNAPALIEAVKRGVMLAGALPVDFPTISLHESFAHPTAMYLRNLMAMDTEEMVRAQPMDAVVLIGGCDKTVPAQLMGAASAGIPAIQLVTGPMLAGSHRGQIVGACTDCRRYWAKHRAGGLEPGEISEVNSRLVPGVGTCSVMGTASTMACVAEALGMMPLGGASAPAVSADRIRIAERTGELAVGLIRRGLVPARILTPAAFENALRVLLAIGGSTNALIHLAAIAGRVGLELDLDAFDRMSRRTPVLVDLKPSGGHYMEDFHRAGGMPVLLRQLKAQLDLGTMTVTGRTLGRELAAAPAPFPQDVVRPRRRPIYREGGIAVLRGNLAPRGALIKQSAATPRLMEHEGRAVVFANSGDLARRIDDPRLRVGPGDVLVLQGIGPVGAPGMPEAGMIPIPRKLARKGVTDMVRISDGRMSGTAAGTIVLHVTPESAVGGPLGLVRTGDRIRLSVKARTLELKVDAAELARRSARLRPAALAAGSRGYARLFRQTVTQADQGCDFDFMRAPKLRGRVPRRT
ncbi:MAG TPA: IlvD/Edd family dehydratase [Opitutaceae bacterium]|jgi:dihydroxy-acid dehydratase|nr:IlvD/Edd family dehydratase [Opitutaceae bacterium]